MVMSNLKNRSTQAKKQAGSGEQRKALGAPKAAPRSKPRKSLGPKSRARDLPLEPPGPPLAMRNDGALLLSVEHFGSKSIEGRETWTAVVLNRDEVNLVRERSENYAQETAAMLVARSAK
jgi:hypothetical protein